MRARGLAAAVGVAVVVCGLVAPVAAADTAVSCAKVVDASGRAVTSVGSAQPVLLVHGFNQGPDTWSATTGIAARLAADGGYFVARFDYSAANQEWVDDPAISQALHDAIGCLSAGSKSAGGDGKVLLVAYSLGGLAVEQAFTRFGSPDDIASAVGGLAAIATPWQGAYFAPDGGLQANATYFLPSLIGAACRVQTRSCGIFSAPNSRAAQALRVGADGGVSAMLQALHDKRALPAKVPTAVVAGAVTWQSDLFGRVQPVNGGDGVADVHSATTPPLDPGPGAPLAVRTISCTSGDPLIIFAPCGHLSLQNNDDVAAFLTPLLGLWRAAAAKAVAKPVDPKSATYRLTCDGSVPGGFTARLSGGAATVTGQEAGTSDYDRLDVTYQVSATGDITGDGAPETVVLLSCSPQPSNFTTQEVEVLGSDGNVVGELPDGASLKEGAILPPQYVPDELAVADGNISAGMLAYGPNDSHASGPSVPAMFVWHWTGSVFTRVS